jgi:rod shape-determining protein MreC
VILAIIAPFILFSSKLQQRETSNPLLLLSQEIVFPVEYMWQNTKNSIAEVWTHYFDLVDAAEENSLLHKQVNELKIQLLTQAELQAENDRLRKQLQLASKELPKVLMAEVIGTYNKNAPFYALRIDRGKTDGVDLSYPVLTSDGVVGRVVRLGRNFSDVQLLTDAGFYVDVLLQRTRVRGVLRGTSKESCQLQLHRKAEVKIGDVVITSGIVGSFPKGLPVGRVMRISYETDNVTQVITVEPWVDPARIEEVVVLKSQSPEIQSIVDAVGVEWFSNRSEKGG